MRLRPRSWRSPSSLLSRLSARTSAQRSRTWPARSRRNETRVQTRRHEGATIMIRRFWRDETGLELSEYAVAAALVALAVITAFTTLGTNIGTKITNLAGKIAP